MFLENGPEILGDFLQLVYQIGSLTSHIPFLFSFFHVTSTTHLLMLNFSSHLITSAAHSCEISSLLLLFFFSNHWWASPGRTQCRSKKCTAGNPYPMWKLPLVSHLLVDFNAVISVTIISHRACSHFPCTVDKQCFLLYRDIVKIKIFQDYCKLVWKYSQKGTRCMESMKAAQRWSHAHEALGVPSRSSNQIEPQWQMFIPLWDWAEAITGC